ncbi:MAG: UDP-N-acetylmuramoyl-tripeptide--D-alanyl-D-alanine ligase, partial [Eggerthellaceae bacterium]|nr:UDP-N-acetylmuramoyl-tripeptide--D-alanyl-D-alanine ligase [Eggerthellaceae bacterium]
KIAHLWFTKLSTISIGITGSVGKTTTRSLVAAVLSKKYRVHATEGNFNNELGLPATVLNAPEGTEALVLEMGMDGAGQIRDLCQVVPVQCGIITTIGTSHMLQLGSQENIARAKAEIFEHMRVGDCAIVPKNDEYVSIIEDSAHLADKNVTTYYFAGTDVDLSREAIRKPHVWASDIALNKDGFPTCTIHAAMSEAEDTPLCGTLTLSLRGEHNISNACAAIAAGLHFGVDFSDCLDAVSAVGAQDGRQKMYTNAHGISVIDDSYNASPESMIASLHMFSALETSGLRIAILGDMGELGEFSQQGHAQVAREVGVLYADTKISKIIFVGSQSEYMKDIAGIPEKDCYTAKDAHMAADIALDILQQGDVVLVKASHFMNMHDIVERILQA